MKRNKLVLASAAAAVLAVFNPAFAGGAEESMTAPPLSEPKAAASTSADVTAGGNLGPSSSPGMEQSSEEKLTGLDRADQVAGEHGQQGRDNARENQAAGTTLGDSTAGAEPGRDALLEKDQVSQAEVDSRTGLDRAHPAN
jgi:hypothetical protein